MLLLLPCTYLFTQKYGAENLTVYTSSWVNLYFGHWPLLPEDKQMSKVSSGVCVGGTANDMAFVHLPELNYCCFGV